MESFRQDLQYAFRYLRKHPGFAAIAVATVALGIGATTAIFSAVNGVLIKSLPYPDAEQLVRVWTTNLPAGVEEGDVSPTEIFDYREQSQAFSDFAAYFPYDVTFTDDDGNAQKVPAAATSVNMFQMMGAVPHLGRFFTEEDAQQSQQSFRLVLGYDVWQNYYSGNPDIIGTSIMAEGFSIEVIGVAPPGFEFPRKAVAWGPFPIDATQPRQARFLNVVARMNEGVSLETARADLAVIAQRLEQEYPESNRNIGVTMETLHRTIVGDLRPALLILLAASAVLLLIASVNVANLLLTRGAVRSTEIAVRTAVGAGRGRIIRQLLTESIALAGVGALGGVALAVGILRGIHYYTPVEMDLLNQAAIDGPVLLFTLGATGAAGLLFGMFPALAAGTPNLRAALGEGAKGSRGKGGANVRSALVTLELALAVVLMLEAGLLVKSFRNLASENPGFDPSSSLVAELSLPFASYADSTAIANFHERYMERLAASPGVQSVSAISSLPFGPMLDFRVPIFVKDREPPQQGSEPQAFFRQVSPNFFQNMRIPLLGGRDLERTDRRGGPPVVVVNQAFKRLVFPDEDPMGKYLHQLPTAFGPLGTFPGEQEAEIVGLVDDFKFSSLAEAVEPAVFFVHNQAPFRRMTLIIRTSGDPLQFVRTVREDLAELDATIATGRVATFETVIAGSYASRRFAVILLTGFAGVALVLAAIGIYGVIGFSVQQRSVEMAIRMALGAESNSIVQLIMTHGLKLAGIGVAVGLFGGWAAARITASQMYGTSARDPLMFVMVAVSLTVVALLATMVPAIRASRISPAKVLKPEQ
ncbi:MAG: ABC transporter permease [Gemmatimonadales bacterium]